MLLLAHLEQPNDAPRAWIGAFLGKTVVSKLVTTTSKPALAPALRQRWARLSPWPGGKWLFSKLLGIAVPYTGALGAQIDTLAPGHCVVILRERRRVRNHLNSVHAIALSNLLEASTGLAVLNGMPDDARGILVALETRYLKKARGTLRAECRCEIPRENTECEYCITGEVRDASGDIVATATAHWLIGPQG